MPVTLPLKEMTLQEKLAIMESLWDELSRSPDAIEVPKWHREILKQRRKRITNGEAQFADWERAKASIRKRA